MPKYDLENLLDDVLAIMNTNLNTRISAIEAEKAAAGSALSPTLAPIAKFYRQTWVDDILNQPVSVFYGIEDVQANDGGGEVAEIVKIFCEVVLVDNGMTNDTSTRILRYARALREIFKENFGEIQQVGNTKIETVRPISFRLALDSNDEIKIGGVSLQAGLFN